MKIRQPLIGLRSISGHSHAAARATFLARQDLPDRTGPDGLAQAIPVSLDNPVQRQTAPDVA
jgi:hypothetical protein